MVPVIGNKGIFTFKSPFDLRTEDIILEVIAIRTFKDLETEGFNILEAIYKKENLTEQDYQNGLENEDLIVIFMGSSNQIFRIPTSFILETPVSNGTFFKEVVLSINVGYIPLDYDIESTKRELENAVLKGLGVVSECYDIEAGKRVVMTDEQVTEFNARISANRSGRKYVDYENRIKQLESEKLQLQYQNEALMNVFNSAYGDPTNPLQPPALAGPSGLDVRNMTKKITIIIEGRNEAFAVSNMVFYQYLFAASQDDDYNDPLVPFRFSSIDTNTFGFAIGRSEMIRGTMTLAQGNGESTVDGFTDLPDIFSKNYFAKFTKGRALLTIEFSKPILLKGITFNAKVGTMAAETYKVRFENENAESYIAIENTVPYDGACGAVKIPISTTPYPPIDTTIPQP